MDSTAAQWPPQDIVVKPMEEMVRCPKAGGVERKIRPQKEQILNCPRCNSTNTKFCYYNNYSLSQPRYFCKTCRRYWTEGGSLRNIPVGGGSRKNKRPGASSSSSAVVNSSTSKRLPDLVPPPQNPNNNPNKVFDSPRGLDLGFALHHHHRGDMIGLVPSSSSPLELLTGLAATSRAFMPDAAAMYSSSSGLGLGFQLPEFKPSSLGFSLDGLGSSSGGGGGGYGSFQGVEEANGKLLFPFEDLKQVSNNGGEESRDQNGDHHNSTGYWNGVIGGGSW